jgi:hypothetical protein
MTPIEREGLQAVIRREQEKVRLRAEARKNEIIQRMYSDSSAKCHVLFVVLCLVVALTIVGAWWNSLRPIVFKV